MSAVYPAPPGNRTADGRPPPAPAAVEFRYTQTDSFVAALHELGASLLVSTYQANKLLVARATGGGLSTLVRTFDRPVGIAADRRRPHDTGIVQVTRCDEDQAASEVRGEGLHLGHELFEEVHRRGVDEGMDGIEP